MRKWDKGIDYDRTYRLFVKKLEEYRGKLHKVRGRRKFVMTAILLTQLANGSRVGEAYEAMEKFAVTRKREVLVRVRKHKNNDMRIMIIPKEIRISDATRIRAVLPEVSLVSVKVFCIREFGFNTHSLRYAFVSHLNAKGVSPQVIAKITKHTNLRYIITYTQEKQAYEILKAIALGKF